MCREIYKRIYRGNNCEMSEYREDNLANVAI
jgi:hypothetical protein